jgi:hypothetical protein
MDEKWLWALLGAGELLLVLVLLLLVSWIRNVAARRRDKLAIRSLVSETRKFKEQRVAQISDFLSSQFGMTGEPLGLAARAMYKAEVGLIQAFASTYLQRNAWAAARFRGQVENSTEPYWSLSADGVVQHVSADEQAAAEAVEAVDGEVLGDDGEVKRLRGENDRLSEELRVTMDTMSRMLTEYSTIFAKDAEIANITVVDETPPAEASSGESPAAAAAEDIETPAAEVAEAEVDAAQAETASQRDDPDAMLGEAGELDDDPDAILAAAAVPTVDAAEQTEETSADEEPLVDPDAILAEAGVQDDDPDAILAAMGQPVAEPAVVDDQAESEDAARFAVDLDPEMKDLSADEEGEDLDLGDDEVEQVRAATERQRVIDADS